MKLVTTIPRGKSIFEWLSKKDLDDAWIFIHRNLFNELSCQSDVTSSTDKHTWFYNEYGNHVESSIAVTNSGFSSIWYAINVITYHKRIDYHPTDNPKKIIMLKLED